MTNSQIKAELLRSACEEEVFPFSNCPEWAIEDAYDLFIDDSQWVHQLQTDDQRTLLLLFAEAL